MSKNIINHKIIKEAILIRAVEQKFLELFSQGKLNGTVHTCVGQEFSALAFAGQLKKHDFVFSNHRCHGHYISFTGDVRGLMAELMGKASGTCGGIGSSQHLCHNNFFSNGVQGGIVPVAAGYALANKLNEKNAIGCVFIGDGTLGEGVLYETLNIVSKWEIPLLIVCENNFYAQSTHQSINLAGDILKRAEAFGIKTDASSTNQPHELMDKAQKAIAYVRQKGKPLFFLTETYRLNAHSKGDDDRNSEEIENHRLLDFLNIFQNEEPHYYKQYKNEIDSKISRLVDEISAEKDLSLQDYYKELSPNKEKPIWKVLPEIPKRQVELLNDFFKEKMKDKQMVFIGEDILSPYGGAFKVSRELSELYPDRVLSTPISEAAITGIANGLALNGFKPYVEIMFGDFITLAFDQIVNHASKFQHMFNHKVNCPMVLRTPMGGKRGYGPTHSQSLERFLIGIDNVKTIALTSLINPQLIYNEVHKEKVPVVVVENKIEYGKRINKNRLDAFNYEYTDCGYPVLRIKPKISDADFTMVTYGGTAGFIAENLEYLFFNTGYKPEIFVLTKIYPLDIEIDVISNSLANTGRILCVEEGNATGSVGSEVISLLHEKMSSSFKAIKLGALPVPIPAVKSLEDAVIPNFQRISEAIDRLFI